MISKESAKSQLRATVSKALAEGLICGIDETAENGRPLTQLQQVDLATMSIMAYSQAIEACELIDVEEQIQKEARRRKR